MAKLKLQPGKFVGAAEIRAVLTSVPSPATPGGLSWGSVLGHGHAAAANKKGKAWPSWGASPEVELGKRVEAHNKAAFDAAFEHWFASMIPMVGKNRWIPKGTPARIVQLQTWRTAGAGGSGISDQ